VAISEGLPSEILMFTGHHYLRRRLVSEEGIVSLGVHLCLCPLSHDWMRLPFNFLNG